MQGLSNTGDLDAALEHSEQDVSECKAEGFVALMLCVLDSKVCGVENLPPLHGRSVMAGVDFYRVFPSWKWRYTREPI